MSGECEHVWVSSGGAQADHCERCGERLISWRGTAIMDASPAPDNAEGIDADLAKWAAASPAERGLDAVQQIAGDALVKKLWDLWESKSLVAMGAVYPMAKRTIAAAANEIKRLLDIIEGMEDCECVHGPDGVCQAPKLDAELDELRLTLVTTEGNWDRDVRAAGAEIKMLTEQNEGLRRQMEDL